jgi:hypothetical protein
MSHGNEYNHDKADIPIGDFNSWYHLGLRKLELKRESEKGQHLPKSAWSISSAPGGKADIKIRN